MAVLTVVPGTRAGIIVSGGAAAAAGGDSFPNTEKEVVVITNGDSGAHDVTFVSPQTVDGQAVADKTVTMAAGATYVIGPFPAGTYSDSGGNVSMTYSAVTSVTVKVIKVAV